MTGAGRNTAAVLAVLALMFVVSGCGWRGLNTLPLPGTEGRDSDSISVQAQLPDVTNLQPNSRVRVGDLTVGTVTKVERQGWHALLTMRVNGDVNLPANATVTIGQTSLLGSLHVELAPPTETPPEGRLQAGAVIPLARAATYPSTEQTLAAVSMVLNGGGIGQLQEITKELSTAFRGREEDFRSLIQQLDLFIASTNEQTDDIIEATDSLNDLVDKFADKKPLVDNAIRTIPDALAVLRDQRHNLTDAVDRIGKFSALAADSTAQTKDALVRELNDIRPVLQSLADAGPNMTRALSLLGTFPFANETVQNWFRGDFGNMTAVVDLTLSRIDAAIFTGTRWEGDLTELELQWGRTIGQFPSPYTSGNPLTVPYNWDQGR
jgi:phospholipid/cholesterol/gamma-HCH transport system substrate-binding protein